MFTFILDLVFALCALTALWWYVHTEHHWSRTAFGIGICESKKQAPLSSGGLFWVLYLYRLRACVHIFQATRSKNNVNLIRENAPNLVDFATPANFGDPSSNAHDAQNATPPFLLYCSTDYIIDIAFWLPSKIHRFPQVLADCTTGCYLAGQHKCIKDFCIAARLHI